MLSAMPVFRVYADGDLIAPGVLSATRFTQRLCGLLRHRTLGHGEGLLLEPGGSIHTLGMSFPIDVVFIDQQGVVLGVRADIAPNRACRAPRGTQSTLELRSGACNETGLRAGQHLTFAANGNA